MNLTRLSLYHGRDIDKPVPSNDARIAEFRYAIPPPLTNNVFRFNNPAPLPERAAVR